MPFSLLMSVYRATDAGDLARCLDSVAGQSLAADEIIIVFDGPVSDGVRRQVSAHSEQLPIRILDFPANRGLGPALRDGLDAARFEIVARMDADDVCAAGRFAEQYRFLEQNPGISVVGGALRERQRSRRRSGIVVRRLPTGPEEVAAYSKMRNPVNHQTAMFRRRDVLAAGSYQPFPLLEDYHLWARMLARGCRIANLPSVFAEATVDVEYYARRGGWSYFVQEMRLAKAFRSFGFHTRWDSARFLAARAPFRLVPTPLRARLYARALRRADELSQPARGLS
jgi:glycosyltransferase involved in cell wall biosynthesis